MNELALKDVEALGRKDMLFIWEGFNGIWPTTTKEKHGGECTGLKQNGEAYKLLEVGDSNRWREGIHWTGQTWRCARQ